MNYRPSRSVTYEMHCHIAIKCYLLTYLLTLQFTTVNISLFTQQKYAIIIRLYKPTTQREKNEHVFVTNILHFVIIPPCIESRQKQVGFVNYKSRQVADWPQGRWRQQCYSISRRVVLGTLKDRTCYLSNRVADRTRMD